MFVLFSVVVVSVVFLVFALFAEVYLGTKW